MPSNLFFHYVLLKSQKMSCKFLLNLFIFIFWFLHAGLRTIVKKKHLAKLSISRMCACIWKRMHSDKSIFVFLSFVVTVHFSFLFVHGSHVFKHIFDNDQNTTRRSDDSWRPSFVSSFFFSMIYCYIWTETHCQQHCHDNIVSSSSSFSFYTTSCFTFCCHCCLDVSKSTQQALALW